MKRGGCVGRLLRNQERWKEDKEWREKKGEEHRKWRENNKEKIRKRYKKWEIVLNEYKNKHCKKCGKLLHYRTKGDYCFKHKWLDKK